MAMQTYEEAMKSDSQKMIIRIDGKEYEGTFSNIRIERKSLPENMYAYDIRHSDDCEIFIYELKNGYIWVNHAGTFVTSEKLPI